MSWAELEALKPPFWLAPTELSYCQLGPAEPAEPAKPLFFSAPHPLQQHKLNIFCDKRNYMPPLHNYQDWLLLPKSKHPQFTAETR